MITIRYGVNSLSRNDFASRTPQDVLDEVGDALNIPADVQVRINNCEARMTDLISDNSTVEFVKVSGEKGATA